MRVWTLVVTQSSSIDWTESSKVVDFALRRLGRRRLYSGKFQKTSSICSSNSSSTSFHHSFNLSPLPRSHKFHFLCIRSQDTLVEQLHFNHKIINEIFIMHTKFNTISGGRKRLKNRTERFRYWIEETGFVQHSLDY